MTPVRTVQFWKRKIGHSAFLCNLQSRIRKLGGQLHDSNIWSTVSLKCTEYIPVADEVKQMRNWWSGYFCWVVKMTRVKQTFLYKRTREYQQKYFCKPKMEMGSWNISQTQVIEILFYVPCKVRTSGRVQSKLHLLLICFCLCSVDAKFAVGFVIPG